MHSPLEGSSAPGYCRHRLPAAALFYWSAPRIFNPIERRWGKIKQCLRACKARTVERWEQALTAAIAAISPHNARAWFQHCGYGIREL